MAITALPKDTVRLLGSHTVIVTPVHLVKELLDNAIDAKSTSVDILVSPNLVDKIEVRDNGHGIHQDDYKHLGHTGHTSKIASFDDLRTLGGTTLGFRGQALASANNLGNVTITTRTAEDSTAIELNLSHGVGGVEGQRRKSAPIGTTVSVTGLYRRLPVREQVAVKDALKNLATIKQLLYAYALARPQIRLSFRILGRHNKQAFSYCPRPRAGVIEAVVQIFGMEVASQCLTRVISSAKGNESGVATEGNAKFSIEAVLPNPDADQARIARGPFFSVDSRPVSAQRETTKKLLAIFKAQFSKSLEQRYGKWSFKDSLICVNIRCSPGTYDANVEPSKDVVLFAEEPQLTNLFERLCSEVYNRPENLDPFTTIGKRRLLQRAQTRTPPTSSVSPGCEEHTPIVQNEVPRNVVTQLQQTPLHSISSPVRESPDKSVVKRRPAPVKINGRGFTVDMSADPDMSSDEEAEVVALRFRQEENDSQANEEHEDPRGALNPWTIAKMNVPVRQTVTAQPLLMEEPEHLAQVQEQPRPAISDEPFENLPILRPFGEAPADLDSPRTIRLGIMPTSHQHSDKLSGFQHPYHNDTAKIPATCDAPQHVSRTNDASVNQLLPNLRSSADLQPTERFPNERHGDAGFDGLVQTGLVFGGRPRDSQNRIDDQKQRHINEIPSKANPPFRKPRRVDTRNRRSSTTNHGHRDKDVANWVDDHRLHVGGQGSMRHQSTPRFPDSPQNSSGTTDIGTIQAEVPSNDSRGDETWGDEDSRKYLMKRQRSQAEHRRRGRQPPKRVKTDRLPLETVPVRQGIQGLVLTVVSDTMNLVENMEHMIRDDAFLNMWRTEVELGNEMGLDDVAEVEMRLKDVLSTWTEEILGERTEVNFDLRRQVKGKDVGV